MTVAFGFLAFRLWPCRNYQDRQLILFAANVRPALQSVAVVVSAVVAAVIAVIIKVYLLVGII